MTRNPDQLHVLETTQPFTGICNQNQQPGDLRAFRSAHIAHGDVAVAAQQQSSRTGLAGHFERRAQRMQFGLVAAA